MANQNISALGREAAIFRAADVIRTICEVAGSGSYLGDIQLNAQANGIQTAVERHHTSKLFDVMLTAFSYQGISDSVARDYMRRYGTATWDQITEYLAAKPSCPRLASYWHYDQCRYDKGSGCCSEPEHIGACPVPTHRLRNGRLNQTAYSFYLFTRDIAENDLVGWIDNQLSRVTTKASDLSHELELQEALIGPLRHVYGISDKTLTMTLSELLMGAWKVRPHWFGVGKAMVAVDTLVHNFLHRTGILTGCSAEHAYGTGCYKSGGCADILRSVANLIDARRFNPAFPRVFPRFVQYAIWQYCAADGLDICNGNRIDDRSGCTQHYCNIFNKCRKTKLNTA